MTDHRKIILHCGFPKTGTTALQHWLAHNQDVLLNLGILYPSNYRDSENIAHHQLNELAGNGGHCLSASLSSIISNQNNNTIFMSTEGLSNLLAAEEGGGSDFFEQIIQDLSAEGVDLELLFTVRSFDKYIRSITIQNILFDQIAVKPSIFAAHTIRALASSYSALMDLGRMRNIRLFSYSPLINRDILGHLFKSASICPDLTGSFGSVHKSPSDSIIAFFLWLNLRKISLSADFHSYLRLDESAREIIENSYLCMLASLQNKASFCSSWLPSAELIDATFSYQRMAWEKALSYRCNEIIELFTPGQLLLRKVLASDLQKLLPDALVDLDYLFESVLSAHSSIAFEQLLSRLVDHGSSVYGQDFSLQISL